MIQSIQNKLNDLKNANKIKVYSKIKTLKVNKFALCTDVVSKKNIWGFFRGISVKQNHEQLSKIIIPNYYYFISIYLKHIL